MQALPVDFATYLATIAYLATIEHTPCSTGPPPRDEMIEMMALATTVSSVLLCALLRVCTVCHGACCPNAPAASPTICLIFGFGGSGLGWGAASKAPSAGCSEGEKRAESNGDSRF